MYEYVDSNSDRIDLFKKGLYNLDCFQIANRHYDIPICGFVKSPIGELTEYGRLGYVQAWELRPVKTALYSLVQSSAQSGFTQKRRTTLVDLYTLNYNEVTHKSLRREFPFDPLRGWNVIVKDYLLARQSYRESIEVSVFNHLGPRPYYPEDLDVINILLSVGKFSSDCKKANLNKRLKVS